MNRERCHEIWSEKQFIGKYGGSSLLDDVRSNTYLHRILKVIISYQIWQLPSFPKVWLLAEAMSLYAEIHFYQTRKVGNPKNPLVG